jgi:hypothetical protein
VLCHAGQFLDPLQVPLHLADREASERVLVLVTLARGNLLTPFSSGLP